MKIVNILKPITIAAAFFVASTAVVAAKKPSHDYKGATYLASKGEREAYKFANPYYEPRCKKVLRDGNRIVWVCNN